MVLSAIVAIFGRSWLEKGEQALRKPGALKAIWLCLVTYRSKGVFCVKVVMRIAVRDF